MYVLGSCTGALFGRVKKNGPGSDWNSQQKSQLFFSSTQHSYWKWPSRNSGFTHWKWWFSIVNLYVYQRVLENALWTYGWSLGVALFSEPPQHPVSAKLLRTELLHWWWLVVDLPLWKILVSWDDDIPNIWKNMIDVLEDSHFFEWSCRFEGNLPRCFWSTFRWSVPRGSWKLRWWMAGRPIGWN